MLRSPPREIELECSEYARVIAMRRVYRNISNRRARRGSAIVKTREGGTGKGKKS